MDSDIGIHHLVIFGFWLAIWLIPTITLYNGGWSDVQATTTHHDSTGRIIGTSNTPTGEKTYTPPMPTLATLWCVGFLALSLWYGYGVMTDRATKSAEGQKQRGINELQEQKQRAINESLAPLVTQLRGKTPTEVEQRLGMPTSKINEGRWIYGNRNIEVAFNMLGEYGRGPYGVSYICLIDQTKSPIID